MKEVPFQDIFNLLQEVLPDDWHKVAFYANYYSENSYSMKFFVSEKEDPDAFADCFDLKSVSKDKIKTIFAAIDNIIFPIRKELAEKETWHVMTMIIDKGGNFKASFDYDDVSHTPYDYYQKWKEQYLR